MSTMPAHDTRRAPSRRVVIIAGVVAAVLLATVVALFASSSPDGLERVAEDVGFADTAEDSATGASPLADYQVGGQQSDGATWRSVGAGVAGLVIMAAVAFVGFGALSRSRGRSEDPQSSR